MQYLLDANIFIESENRFYNHKICPGFWKWLEQFGISNFVITIQRVKIKELLPSQDDLAKWVKKQPDSFFLDDQSIEI